MSKRHRTIRLTREGATFLIIIGCIFGASFIQNVNLLVLIFSLMLAPLLLSYWLAARNLRGLSFRRRLPEAALVGEPFDVFFSIEAEKRRRPAQAIAIEDRLSTDSGGPAETPVVLFPEIAPGSACERSYRAIVRQRGRYRLGPAAIYSTYPFGFFERRRYATSEDTLVVFPHIGRLTPECQRAMSGSWLPGPALHTSRTGEPSEFHGLREYRAGDNPRHIHWRTTARRGSFMVKEFEPRDSAEIILIVEPWLPAKPTADDFNAVEVLISFAATFVVAVSRQSGVRFALTIAGKGGSAIVRHGMTSPRLTSDCLHDLAIAEASDTVDWQNAVEKLLSVHRSTARIWLIGVRDYPGADDFFRSRFGARSFQKPLILNITAGNLDSYFSV